MNYTPYLELKEPQTGEAALVGDLNDNAESIDDAFQDSDQMLAPIIQGDTAPAGGLSAGQFIIKDRTLYTVDEDLLENASLTGKLTPVTTGGLNTLHDQMSQIVSSNAASHNAIYRGKYLGSGVTGEQYAAILAGTFDDMFIGDYWTIGNVNWRIAAFDYWLHCGDTECTTHHVVIVPDSNLYTAQMNTSNTTSGGYVGSKMYTANLASAKSTINSAFGSGHILNHRELLSNSVSGNTASNWSWYDSTVELMNECMVYGTVVNSKPVGDSVNFNVGIDHSQLPLFRHNNAIICNRAGWWLRCVVSSTGFAYVNYRGYADTNAASNSSGVRPAFGIH